jgi:hypothetical protein
MIAHQVLRLQVHLDKDEEKKSQNLNQDIKKEKDLQKVQKKNLRLKNLLKKISNKKLK